MKQCTILLAILAFFAAAIDNPSLPGIHMVYEKQADGSIATKSVAAPAGLPTVPSITNPLVPAGNLGKILWPETRSVFSPQYGPGMIEPLTIATPRSGTFASLLWVDRNHRYGIPENVAITADGMNIVSGWWLNAKRVSCYRTMGTSTPLWEYSLGNIPQWMISVAASGRGEALAAAEGNISGHEWSKGSQLPRWTYDYPGGPKGRGAAVSKNGQVVAIPGAGLLYVFNAQTGETLYTRPFNPTRGLTGIGGGGQNCVDVSSDGSFVTVSTYDSIYVWRNRTRVANLPGYGQTPARISDDGRIVVIGNFNGQVAVYRWNGSGYDTKWTAGIGGWVSAVDVSGDGSTIMAGTGPSNGGVYMFDSSSSTPLWNYSNFGSYGAMTTCVDLSYNGSYAAATSWGDTVLTGTFDVLAVFRRASGTPIFEVTRDQEPGSLWYCDISDSGDFVTGSGKAVHAYRMGNGGEVYSIQVFTTLTHDVGMTQLISPPELLEIGQNHTPQVEVKNFGSSTETFPVQFEIFDSLGARIYNATVNVSNLAPNATAQPTFSPSWNVTQQGWYTARATSQLTGDQFRANDTMSLVMRCYHDVGVTRITAPFPEITINYPMAPAAVATNLGSYTESFPVVCQIRDSASTLVYADTAQVSGLAPYGQVAVNFGRTWAPNRTGPYAVSVFSTLTGDYRPANDRMNANSRCTYEIIYDDGGAEAYYWVGRSDNDKFYVRFSPTITPPFSLKRGRIMVNMASTPFDYVLLVPDSAGLPDTAHPLQRVDNVSASQAPGWAEFNLDVNRYDANDVWLVLHWPNGSPAMGVGSDANQPRDLRSYWSSNQDPFTQWQNHDWMVRLLQDPNVGITEEPSSVFRVSFAGPQPNPFTTKTRLCFTLPVSAECNLAVYNTAGQAVCHLIRGRIGAGVHQVTWHGRSDRGVILPSGVYFVKLTTPEESVVHKVILHR